MQVGIQISRCQHDVNIVGIVGQTSRESACVVDAGFPQALFERSIAHQYDHAEVDQFSDPSWIFLDYDEGLSAADQSANQMRAYASGAADNEMVSQFAHFPGQPSLAKRGHQL